MIGQFNNYQSVAHRMTTSLVSVVMAIAALSAAIGLGCTIAYGVSMWREYSKRVTNVR
jgi:hypothetical protein